MFFGHLQRGRGRIRSIVERYDCHRIHGRLLNSRGKPAWVRAAASERYRRCLHRAIAVRAALAAMVDFGFQEGPISHPEWGKNGVVDVCLVLGCLMKIGLNNCDQLHLPQAANLPETTKLYTQGAKAQEAVQKVREEHNLFDNNPAT